MYYDKQTDKLYDNESAMESASKKKSSLELFKEKHGIVSVPMDHASIGFSEKEQKWYGWSHRAFCGFGIGHIAKEGGCHTTSGWTEEYLKEHPEEDLSVPVGFECKTLEDCKRCAIAFAESVS